MKKNQVPAIVLMLVLFLFGLNACSNRESKYKKTRSLGGTSEILVVLQNEGQWNTQIGQVIRQYFAKDQYGLPQSEPLFKLLHIKVANFSDLFQKHRNILIVEIDPKVVKPKIETKKDFWASPQQVFKITAPSAEEFVRVFKLKHQFFIEKYLHSERERIRSVFRPSLNTKAMAQMKKAFGFTMEIPSGFYVAKAKPGFMWLRREAVKYSQGIVIFSEPYRDTLQFSRKSILARCQQYERQYIPGPTEGSYMTKDMTFVPPKARLVDDFPAGYTVELRGLWKVQNDFMGGPFVSYTFLHPTNHQIITLEGYVYQPNRKKRDLMLQVESILYSIKF